LIDSRTARALPGWLAIVVTALLQAMLEAAWAVLQNPAPAARYQLLAATLVVAGASLAGLAGRLLRLPASVLLACWAPTLIGLHEGRKAFAIVLVASVAVSLLFQRLALPLLSRACVVGAATAGTVIAARSWARTVGSGILPHSYGPAVLLGALFLTASVLLVAVARPFAQRPAVAAAATALLALIGVTAPVAPAAWRRVTEVAPPTLPVRREGPNFLVLMLDTLRADHLGLYGYPRDTTPRLREFLGRSSNAVVFRNAYAPGPWTVPSHASLFTGVLPFDHGADMPLVPPPSLLHYEGRTLAEQLLATGYRTIALFSNPWLELVPGFGRGFEIYRKLGTPHVLPPTGERLRAWLAPGWCSRVENPEVSGSEVAVAVLEALDEDHGRFVFANFMDVHSPFAPEPETIGRFGPVGPRDRYPAKPCFRDGDAFIQRQLDRYDEKIAYLDTVLAGLLTRLDADRVLANTWTFIVSDHGESFDEHGTLLHGSTLYNEQMRIPMIVLPPAGTRLDDPGEPVSLLDVTATIRAIAGVDAGGPGHDLRRPRADDAAVRAEFAGVIWHPDLARDRSVEQPTLAVVRGRYKLLLQPQRTELFDLERDAGERTNLADEHPEIVRQLSAIAGAPAEFRRRRADAPRSGRWDDETKRRLQALGYLEAEAGNDENGSDRR